MSCHVRTQTSSIRSPVQCDIWCACTISAGLYDRLFVFPFWGIIQKAKEILQGSIRETAIPPKPVLSVDMAEYEAMKNLMEKARSEARVIQQSRDIEKPKLEKQLSEITGLFKGKERKALTEKIERTQQEIDRRLKRLPKILKDDGYPDVQAFKQVYDKATALVEQYQRDLTAWERQAADKRKPKREKPPEKESVLKKFREYEVEGKSRNTRPRKKPQHHNYDMER